MASPYKSTSLLTKYSKLLKASNNSYFEIQKMITCLRSACITKVIYYYYY